VWRDFRFFFRNNGILRCCQGGQNPNGRKFVESRLSKTAKGEAPGRSREECFPNPRSHNLGET